MSDENTDELTRAVLATVIFVAKKLSQDRALLLPHAVSFFLDSYLHSAETELYLELEYGKTNVVEPINRIPPTIHELRVYH